jgi:16S rRNA processing protein RimM
MLLEEDSFIACAVIGAPFGVRGALHVYPKSGQNDHLVGLKEFFYKKDGAYVPLKVQSSRIHQDHLVVSFESIETPETAKTMVHQEIFAQIQSLPQLPDNQYYWYQLQGLAVSNLEEHDLGSVVEIYSNGPQDVLLTSEKHHIPFIMNLIIKDVDLENKTITVDFNPVYLEA